MPTNSLFPARRTSVRFHRLFGALELLVARFGQSAVDGFLVPGRPVPLADVVNAFFDTEESDPVEIWGTGPADSLIWMAWDCGPGGSSSQGIDAVTLPSRRRAYVTHSENEGLHVIAVSARTFRPEVEDHRFLEAAVKSNGEEFGVLLLGTSFPAEFGLSAPSDAQAIALAVTLINSAELMEELRSETDLWWPEHGCVGHTCNGRSAPFDELEEECICEAVAVIEGWLRNQGVIRPVPKARRRERRAKGAKAVTEDTTRLPANS